MGHEADVMAAAELQSFQDSGLSSDGNGLFFFSDFLAIMLFSDLVTV